MKPKTTNYRWPDLSSVARQYIVVDDQGRYGIGVVTDHADTIAAHPIGVQSEMDAKPEDGLPENAIIMTRTIWHLQDDGTYTGTWYDYSGPSHTPDNLLRRLTIVSDLGIRMPAHWADIALARSDEMGHWNYGATLGKIGGKPPVKGQKYDEMTVPVALEYAKEVGEEVSDRGIRKAAKNGHI